MDQTQPFVNTPPVNAGDAPVAAAVIPAGMTAAQRLEQLKADPTYMRRWLNGDKGAEAELLALARNAGRQPTAPAPVAANTTPTTGTLDVVSQPFSIPAGMTPADASARLDELKQDKEWGARWLKGGPSSREARELDALQRHAIGQQQPASTREPTECDRALAALGAPPTPEDYKVNARDPVRGWPLKLDEETRTLVHGTLLPAAHALDLSQSDLDMIVMQVQKPMDFDKCEASLKRIYGNGLDAALDDFRAAVSAHPKGRELSELLKQYPETLGNNPAVISSIVAAKRRKGAS